eukprot:11214609-Alexandrium_andersonii.AAC.1
MGPAVGVGWSARPPQRAQRRSIGRGGAVRSTPPEARTGRAVAAVRCAAVLRTCFGGRSDGCG